MYVGSNDVLIIGAGMAGLTAARTLAEAGLRVLVLEAQDRIGGRIHTQRVGTEVLELGAEFIHGRPPELWALIEKAGLATYERTGAQLCFEDGALTTCSNQTDRIFAPLEGLEDYSGPDISFAEYLDHTQTPIEERSPVIGFVEGFNAADHRVISAASLGLQQKAEEAIEGDRSYRLRDGYDRLPEYLAQRIAEHGGSVRLSTPIHEVRWQPGRVEALPDTDSFTAKKAVVTVPLGVLQSGAISINPPPDTALQAAKQLRMGNARRFTLLFRERFWENLPPQPGTGKLHFMFSFAEMPPVWWTPYPEPSNTITGWIGGPRSAAFATINPDEIARKACATLAKIFNLHADHVQGLLLGCYTHDWQHDPFCLGAYSYVAAGGLDAPHQMSQPIANTLYFAGEHTDTTGHWGTVHAAIRSGHRAAAQILNHSSTSSE
jgi:monoamine oxidase